MFMNIITIALGVLLGMHLNEHVLTPLIEAFLARQEQRRAKARLNEDLADLALQFAESRSDLEAKRDEFLRTHPDADPEQVEREFKMAVKVMEMARKVTTAKLLHEAGEHDEEERVVKSVAA